MLSDADRARRRERVREVAKRLGVVVDGPIMYELMVRLALIDDQMEEVKAHLRTYNAELHRLQREQRALLEELGLKEVKIG